MKTVTPLKNSTRRSPEAGNSAMQATTLNELEFTDFVCDPSDINAAMWLKGVPGYSPEALVPIMESVRSDANHLRDKARQESGNYPDVSSFVLEHKGAHYRIQYNQAMVGEVMFMRRIMPLRRLAHQITDRKLTYRLLQQHRGLVVFCGDQGAGKTTTAAAFVGDSLRRYGGHAITLEDPPEVMMQGEFPRGDKPSGHCWQFIVEEENDGFKRGIKKALRSSQPRILFISELRDAAAAYEAMLASKTGFLVVTTLHATDIPAGIHRLIDLVVEARRDGEREAAQQMVADALSSILYLEMSGEVENRHIEPSFLFKPRERHHEVSALIRNGRVDSLVDVINKQKNRAKRSPGTWPADI